MSSNLPPGLAKALRPALPELAQDIIIAIGREIPAYARPLEGPFGRALRVGVERALARFVDAIERPDADDGGAREIYVALGRGEMRAGRSLDALLSAYRIGARLAWERFLAAGEAAGHEPRTLYLLASAIFDYIDGISAESVEGFTEERAPAEGARSRRSTSCARARAAACARPCAHGSTIPGRSRGWPASCTCTRRPCATGSLSCASSSATASRTPTRGSSWRSRCGPSPSSSQAAAARPGSAGATRGAGAPHDRFRSRRRERDADARGDGRRDAAGVACARVKQGAPSLGPAL